jgi:hypothetical protein
MELKTIVTNASQQRDTDVFFFRTYNSKCATLHRYFFLFSLVSDEYYNMTREEFVCCDYVEEHFDTACCIRHTPLRNMLQLVCTFGHLGIT